MVFNSVSGSIFAKLRTLAGIPWGLVFDTFFVCFAAPQGVPRPGSHVGPLGGQWIPKATNNSTTYVLPLGHRLPGRIESIAPAHQNKKASSQVPRLRTKAAWAPIMSTTVGSQGSPALPLRTKVREPRLKYRACAQKLGGPAAVGSQVPRLRTKMKGP